jgi:aminopeptidase
MTLLEEVAMECYRKGAIPLIVVTSDRYAKMVYDEVPAKTLEITSKSQLAAIKACDMLIHVEDLDDPVIATHFPREKLKARQKAMLPILDIIYDKRDGKKWLYAGWPTRKAAKAYGVGYDVLEDIIIGGISVPPTELMKTGLKFKKRFRDASWVHVWDDKGTDFTVKVEGRRLNIDDGVISREDYAVGDRGANLPAGEVFYAPHETVGEGTLYCPITTDRMSERPVRDVHLEFRNGRLLMDKLTASTNEKAMLASFKECEEVDRKKYDPVRTTNVAELGIGFNNRIKKAIGYILTDEKVTGTVHLAFGSNNTYGGKSESVMHWDFVSAPGINIEVERVDGKKAQVMAKGKLL